VDSRESTSWRGLSKKLESVQIWTRWSNRHRIKGGVWPWYFIHLTLSSLSGSNLIKLTDFFPKQAEDFNLHLVEPFNQVMGLVLHSHADPMNPFEELEDPTQGWPRRLLVDLIGYGVVLTHQLPAQSALGHRIHQEG
jgi:hypothetical protein